MNDIIDPNFVGIYRTYYISGELKSEVFVNAGKKEGIYKSYYKSGELLSEVNYIDNKRQGIYKNIMNQENYMKK
jgi:antitoxin component YwqK of YwqJK toxin-antitoxin module